MRQWLCCDGGGTKIIALLVDEDLTIIRSAVAGGVNPNFSSVEHVRRNLNGCIRDAVKDDAPSVAGCYASMPAPPPMVNEALTEAGVHGEAAMVGEGAMGLLAGVGSRYGFAAQSGTGSDVFYDGPSGSKMVGGMGLLLGDEGSGAHMGQKGLMAAIRAMDGRGGDTILEDELLNWLGLTGDTEGTDIYGLLGERVYGSPSPRGVLASFAPHVTSAYERGDEIAGQILVKAGEDMAEQMIALIKGLDEKAREWAVHPSTVCGGAWKGSRLMFRAYTDALHLAYPDIHVQWPQFEPVAGGAVLLGLQLGYTAEEIFRRMEHTFADFRYPNE